MYKIFYVGMSKNGRLTVSKLNLDLLRGVVNVNLEDYTLEVTLEPAGSS